MRKTRSLREIKKFFRAHKENSPQKVDYKLLLAFEIKKQNKKTKQKVGYGKGSI